MPAFESSRARLFTRSVVSCCIAAEARFMAPDARHHAWSLEVWPYLLFVSPLRLWQIVRTLFTFWRASQES